jgi:hypothetical protein
MFRLTPPKQKSEEEQGTLFWNQHTF